LQTRHRHLAIFIIHSTNLDLDPDTAQIDVDALSHTPMPSMSVDGCCLHLFPGKSRSS